MVNLPSGVETVRLSLFFKSNAQQAHMVICVAM